MSFDEGLAGRFHYNILFEDFDEADLRAIFIGIVRESGWRLETAVPIAADVVTEEKGNIVASVMLMEYLALFFF